jgi:hypothetical protein
MSVPEISTNGKPKKMKAHQVNEKFTSFSCTKNELFQRDCAYETICVANRSGHLEMHR